MNLTKRQEKTMREMCIEQRSNMEIALELGIPVTAVYAWRSRNKLTRKHVEDLLATRLSDSLPLPAVSVPELTAADVNVDARKYRDWCLKQRDFAGLATLICTILDEMPLCDGCADCASMECSLKRCAPQLAAYLSKLADEDCR